MNKSKSIYASNGIHVKTRRPIVLQGQEVPAGTLVKLNTLQRERNDMLQIRFNGRLHSVDPIDFEIPKRATRHLEKGSKLYAQGLEI